MSKNASPPSDDELQPGFLRTWIFRVALVSLGLFFGLGVPYIWYLDKQVRTEFAQLQWQVPTRVYARPLVLRDGVRLTPEALELELTAASYRNDGVGQLPGTYSRAGPRFRIGTRAFTDMDGPVREHQLETVLVSGRVAQVRDASKNRRVQSARIDPARIATLYGIDEVERRLVRMDDVPELLITGLQAVEDRNFKHHHGIDPWGVMRAIWVNMREAGFEQGASTLTQQMVRSLFLSNTKTVTRKVKEALYALIIEARFDKRTILESYLNQVYLGQQGKQSIHGVAAGADFWFGRELQHLAHRRHRLVDRHHPGSGLLESRAGFRSARCSDARSSLDVFAIDRTDHAGRGDPGQGHAARREQQAGRGAQSRPGLPRPGSPAAGARLSGRRAARRRPDRDQHDGAVRADPFRARRHRYLAAGRTQAGPGAAGGHAGHRRARPAKCWPWSATAGPTSRGSTARSRHCVRSARCSSPSSTCSRWPSRIAIRWPVGWTTVRSR